MKNVLSLITLLIIPFTLLAKEFPKKMKKINLFLILILSAGLISCGGTWVSFPGPFGKCTDKDKKDIEKDGGKAPMSGLGGLFQSICMKMQKQYAGEYRCKDGHIQVKCK